MRLNNSTLPTPRVSDLVLEPFAYSDSLRALVRGGRLSHDAVDHLCAALPTAIAQLEALGDAYGAIALAGLYEQLADQPIVA